MSILILFNINSLSSFRCIISIRFGSESKIQSFDAKIVRVNNCNYWIIANAFSNIHLGK